MIALGLLILFGLYIAVLVIAWRTPQSKWGKYIAVVVVLSPVIWKTWDIPVGHYRFRQACEEEAGIKVYDPNPAPAKRLRMEGGVFGSSSAEYLLNKYPFLQRVEAQDRKYSYVTPTVYAVYERLSDGAIGATLVDKVGQINGVGEVKLLDSAPSQAEYVISQTKEYLPFRLHKLQHTLRHIDGRPVATVTAFGYTDTNPYNSLFGMPWGRAEGCGPSEREKDILLALITPKH